MDLHGGVRLRLLLCFLSWQLPRSVSVIAPPHLLLHSVAPVIDRRPLSARVGAGGCVLSTRRRAEGRAESLLTDFQCELAGEWMQTLNKLSLNKLSLQCVSQCHSSSREEVLCHFEAVKEEHL